MSKLTNSALLALLVAGAGFNSIACSKAEEPASNTRAWACQSLDVPAGESIRCTSAAMTLDAPIASDTTTGGAGGSATGSTTTTTGSTDGTTAGTTTTGGAGGTAGSSGGATTTTGSTDGTTAGGGTTTTGGAGGTAGSSSGGVGSDGVVVFECPLGNDNPDCPDDSHGNGKGNNGVGNGNGGANGSYTGGSQNGSTGTTAGNNGNGNGGGASSSGGNNGNGGTNGSNGTSVGGGTTSSSSGGAGGTTSSSGGTTGSDGTSVGGSTSGGGGSSAKPGECDYVPDLPYCEGAGGSGGSSTGTGTGTGTGTTTTCDKNNCNGNGNTTPGSSSGGTSSGGTNGNGGTNGGTSTGSTSSSGGSSSGGSSSGGSSSGGATSSSSSSSGSSGSNNGNGGGGHSYTCTKDAQGNITCDSTPSCAPGTHASACGACIEDGTTDDCVPPSEGGCWVTGGGFIEAPTVAPVPAPADGHDNFGGNAKPMKKGGVSGHWNHVDHGTGNHALGRPEYIVCRHVDEPGPGQPGGKKGLTANQVYFGGHARWRVAADAAWGDGFWFDVVAKDHGEPGSSAATKKGQMPDTYHFTLRKMDDPAAKVSGAIVYETKGELSGGNIQMHPNNNGHPAVNMSLPSWVAFEP